MFIKNNGVKLPEDGQYEFEVERIDPRDSIVRDSDGNPILDKNGKPKVKGHYLQVTCRETVTGFTARLVLAPESSEVTAQNKLSRFLSQCGVKEGKSVKEAKELYGKRFKGNLQIREFGGRTFIDVVDVI